MKQFQYTKPRGSTYGPFSADEVVDVACAPHVLLWAHTTAIGTTCEDSDGDVWTRLPDLGETPIVVTDQTARDERLERIATAVLTGLAAIPNNSLQLTVEDVVRIDAERAVVYAKALIAELDKQA